MNTIEQNPGGGNQPGNPKQLRYAGAAIVAIAAAIALLVLRDTHDARVKGDLAMRLLSGPALGSTAAELDVEANRVQSCLNQEQSALYGSTATPLSDSWRACMMTAMVATKTMGGGVPAAFNAARWMAQHPDDIEFRSAALAALAASREDLLKKKPLYEAMDAEAIATQESVVYRRLYPHVRPQGQFVRLFERFNSLEYALYLPSVAKTQIEWWEKAQSR
jgi:hypothetical protein